MDMNIELSLEYKTTSKVFNIIDNQLFAVIDSESKGSWINWIKV